AAHDPVCGMLVDPATASHWSEHAGHTYYFCSNKCCERFEADPTRYVTLAPPEPPRPADGKVLWTCPMHPQIVRNEPGTCPSCGMALEPMTPVSGEAVNPELRDMTRRFWVCVALSLPLLAMTMADHFAKPALDALIAPRAVTWVKLALGTP